MRVPVYLKSQTEGSAVLVGAIDLTPAEAGYTGGIDRTYQRFCGRLEGTLHALGKRVVDYSKMADESPACMPVHHVHLLLNAGPHGLLFARHSVPMTHYAEALEMWQQVALEQAALQVEAARKYAGSKTDSRYGPNTD
jgi:hypothetical protein